MIVTCWILLNKLHISGTHLTDPTSCDFSKVSYWTVLNKYFIQGPYLMDGFSCDFFSKVRFKYLKVKYWTYWAEFKKCVISDHIWWTRFHVTFFEGSFWIFRIKILDLLDRVQFTPEPFLMDWFHVAFFRRSILII